MKYCINCGQELMDNMKFCPNCGVKITNEKSIENSDEYIQEPETANKTNAKIKISNRALIVCCIIFFIFVLCYALGDNELDSMENKKNETISSIYEVPDYEEFKKTCENVTYSDLSHYPDRYESNPVKISGKVLQVLEDEDNKSAHYRIATSGDFEDIILCYYEKHENDTRLIEDDYVTIYGYGGGITSYEAVSGANISLPLIIVTCYDLL